MVSQRWDSKHSVRSVDELPEIRQSREFLTLASCAFGVGGPGLAPFSSSEPFDAGAKTSPETAGPPFAITRVEGSYSDDRALDRTAGDGVSATAGHLRAALRSEALYDEMTQATLLSKTADDVDLFHAVFYAPDFVFIDADGQRHGVGRPTGACDSGLARSPS
jgi:hypothetical protein